MNNWKQLSPSSYITLAMGQAYGMTDTGITRSSNEDNFLINQEVGLILIGDGMGGHEAGEVASAEALLAVCDFIKKINPPQQDSDLYTPTCSSAHDPLYDPDATLSNDTMPTVMRLYDAVEFANSMLYAQNLAKNNEEGCGMGTTLTGFWQVKKDGPVVFFHVGDSRLYRYREGELSQLTRDQTLYQQAIEQGMLEDLPPRDKLLQAVGPSLLTSIPKSGPYNYKQMIYIYFVQMACMAVCHMV